MLHEVFLFMFMIKQSVSVYDIPFESDTLVSDTNGALSYLERQLYSAMMLINTI